MTITERIYVSPTEAADRLGVDPRTIRRYISDGRLPAYKLGHRTVRIKTTDLDKLPVPIPTGIPA